MAWYCNILILLLIKHITPINTCAHTRTHIQTHARVLELLLSLELASNHFNLSLTICLPIKYVFSLEIC
jgi:hypothetical protein